MAEYDAGEEIYDVTEKLPVPVLDACLIAPELDVPGNRVRLGTPPGSDESFGIKQQAEEEDAGLDDLRTIEDETAARLIDLALRRIDRNDHLHRVSSLSGSD